MSEKMGEVYEAYDMEVQGVARGRGTIILRTDKGIRQVFPVTVSEERLRQEKEFKESLYEEGFRHIERLIENTEGELITYDRYGNPFVIKEYFDGRECNPTSLYDLASASENLAIFHVRGRTLYASEERTYAYKEPGNFARKTKEIKKIRSFISKRPVKCDFEQMYMEAFDMFYEQAVKCQEMMAKCSRTDLAGKIGYCHGSYNYHSVLFCDGYMATVNFDRFHVGYQLTDLYQYIRKVLEKNNYNFNIAVRLMEEYDRIIHLTNEDYRYIYILYSYPEKFWKISNRYMNSKKCWISPANLEKLKKVITDEQKKQEFLREFCNHYGFTSE